MAALAVSEPETTTNEDERIGDLLAQRAGHTTPWFSFEFYPPKAPEGVQKLYERLAKMAVYNPLFVDFTWGAGGSTAELTLELTIEARRRFGLLANMHLTCTNMPTEKVTEALAKAKEAGITNILALRGGTCVCVFFRVILWWGSGMGGVFCLPVPDSHPFSIVGKKCAGNR
jgi:hypothetical protein